MVWTDAFSKTLVCPQCRTSGAKKFFLKIKCLNPQCINYDSQMNFTPVAPVSAPQPKSLTGQFDPGLSGINIEYRNFKGEDRVYRGDRRTLNEGKDYISLCLVPTGKRASFNKKFVRNLSSVQAARDDSAQELPAKAGQHVTVKFRNFQGLERVFQTDSSLLSSDSYRVILRLKPDGRKFYLKKTQIINLGDISFLLNK